MDLIVARAAESDGWSLTDLLGRSMGSVTEEPGQAFTIRPAGHALETMKGIRLGPHASLDEALAEIERYLFAADIRKKELKNIATTFVKSSSRDSLFAAGITDAVPPASLSLADRHLIWQRAVAGLR